MKQLLITKYFVPIKTTSKRKIQSLMTDFVEIININESVSEQKNKPLVYGYNPETDSWHCLECGEDIGKNNPRQLCGKIYCRYKYF